MVDIKTLGRRIQHLRKWRGLTQAELASKIGVKPAFVGHLECGRSLPSYRVLLRIISALDATPNEVLEE